MSENIKILCLDWLQINGLGLPSESESIKLRDLGYQTKHFKQVNEVFLNKKLVGTLAYEPHSPILNPAMVLLKFENKLLYDHQIKVIVYDTINALGLKNCNISRVDISLDFEKFDNDLDPQEFLQDFFKSKYLRNGRGKFRAVGEQKYHHTFDYLRFGSPQTNKSIYLYNKSKEFREVRTKYHIIDTWKLNGLETENDVWRLELSLKGNSHKIVNKQTGETKQYTLEDLFNPQMLKLLYMTGINDLFTFKINNGTQNKSRMKVLHLFYETAECNKLLKLPEEEDVSRSEKIFLKKLYEYNQELKGKSFDLSIASEKLLAEFVHSHRLSKYFIKISSHDKITTHR